LKNWGRTKLSSLEWFGPHAGKIAHGELPGLGFRSRDLRVGIRHRTWRSGGFSSRPKCIFSIGERILFLLIGLSAALIEEALFRGYIQPVAMSKYGKVGGLMMTAFLFARSSPILLGRFKNSV